AARRITATMIVPSTTTETLNQNHLAHPYLFLNSSKPSTIPPRFQRFAKLYSSKVPYSGLRTGTPRPFPIRLHQSSS
ncbi:MAG: hypothetical protein ACTSWF_04375, partial [Candidatus Freyarchaeota archaeon]